MRSLLKPRFLSNQLPSCFLSLENFTPVGSNPDLVIAAAVAAYSAGSPTGLNVLGPLVKGEYILKYGWYLPLPPK